MRNVEENFGLRFYGRVGGKRISKADRGGRSGFVGQRRDRSSRKHRTLLGDGLPRRPSAFLLLLQHLHHGAMMLAVPPATGWQIRLRASEERGQSSIASENEKQRTGDETSHG